jgi:hypothetical protein
MAARMSCLFRSHRGGLCWGALVLVLACRVDPPASFASGERRALADTLLGLFDSVSAIHSSHPDTGLLRRLHPPADTVVYVEGNRAESFTGDSLLRRVLALHRAVAMMDQRFTDRSAQVLDRDAAFVTATEAVRWRDSTGTHEWQSIMTLIVARRGGRWVIRAYRG